MSRRLKLTFLISDPQGEKTIILYGKVARTLRALILSGKSGITALGCLSYTLRLSEYIRSLRHDYYFNIETKTEKHNGIDGAGTHGRYILHTPVKLLSKMEAA